MKNFSLSDNIFYNSSNNDFFKSIKINDDSLIIDETNDKNNNKNNIFKVNSIKQQYYSTPLNSIEFERNNQLFNINNNNNFVSPLKSNQTQTSSFQIKIFLSSLPDSTEITTDLKKLINSFLLELDNYQKNLLIENLLNSSLIQKYNCNDNKENYNLYIINLYISQNKIKTIGDFKMKFNNLFDIYYKIYKNNIYNIQYLKLKNFLEYTQKLLKKFENNFLNLHLDNNIKNNKNEKDNNIKEKLFTIIKDAHNNNEINKKSKEKKNFKNKNICINKLKNNTKINKNLKFILLNILDQILFSKYGNKFNQIFFSKNIKNNNKQITINKLKQMINLNKIKTINEFKKKLFLIFDNISNIIKKNSKNYKIIKETLSISKEIINKTYYHIDYSRKNSKNSRKKKIKNLINNSNVNINNIKKEKEDINNNNKEKNDYENIFNNKGTLNNKEKEILLEKISKLNDDGFIHLSEYLEKNSPEIIEISEKKNEYDLIKKIFYFNKLSLNKKEEVINYINILLTNDKNLEKE